MKLLGGGGGGGGGRGPTTPPSHFQGNGGNLAVTSSSSSCAIAIASFCNSGIVDQATGYQATGRASHCGKCRHSGSSSCVAGPQGNLYGEWSPGAGIWRPANRAGAAPPLTRYATSFVLAPAYSALKAELEAAGDPMPVNTDRTGRPGDKTFRNLDCAVIRQLHQLIEEQPARGVPGIGKLEPYDTVRGLFEEGPEAYPGAGFRTRTHSQIAVRTLSCIKGLFYFSAA